MLKLYADTFKLSEAELSEESLKRLKLFTLLGLPGFPLIGLLEIYNFDKLGVILIAISAVVSLGFLSVVLMSRFTNRFWARDKYLDEWEVARKHHAMAIGHQITDYMFVFLAGAFFILSFFIKQTVTLDLGAFAGMAFGVVLFMVLVPHIFLLWTVSPTGKSSDMDDREKEAGQKRAKLILLFSSLVVGVGFIAGFLSAHLSG